MWNGGLGIGPCKHRTCRAHRAPKNAICAEEFGRISHGTSGIEIMHTWSADVTIYRCETRELEGEGRVARLS